MARKKVKAIQDPVLGKLSFDVLWEGEIEMGPLGSIELQVDGGNGGDIPTEAQQHAITSLQRSMPKLIDKIYDAIFRHYCENRDDYLEFAIDPDEDVPELASAKEIDQVLNGPPTLFVGFHDKGETPSVKLAWSTTFDDEHGLEVEIIDGVIQDVGRP